MTQVEVAEVLGVGQSTVQRDLEPTITQTGKTDPRGRLAKKTEHGSNKYEAPPG